LRTHVFTGIECPSPPNEPELIHRTIQHSNFLRNNSKSGLGRYNDQIVSARENLEASKSKTFGQIWVAPQKSPEIYAPLCFDRHIEGMASLNESLDPHRCTFMT
jgi:hypothetical protein